ncbi:MAG TPA: hypothetical protein VFC19_28980 [Candidatus Limnocylindrales bacterium]|nr:hypothetical protein [Candidatus Limnocylindrales bacterium]
MRLARRDGDSFTGSVTIGATEPVLSGHFPGFPIFPGVCLIECAHQTALLALADRVAAPHLSAIERTRFLAPVFPGDEVTAEVTPVASGDGWSCRATVLTTRRGETVLAAQLKLRYGPLDPAPSGETAPAGSGELFGLDDLKAILPHREPMLLIDSVEERDLIGVKAVTLGEPCFAGLHPDDDHSYPEVLMVESWCQAAGVLAVHDRPNPDVMTGRVTLFGSISDVTFHAPVRPGDVMRHRVSPLKIMSDAAVFEGHAFVDRRPVMTVGQIVIALRPASEV